MLNTNHLKFIISFILFLSTNSILFSQVRPKPSPDKPIKQEKLYYRATAQNLNVINSNRPGFSISPYNVGAKIFQIETGFLGYTEYINDTSVDVLKHKGLDLSIRYAINDRLEIYSDLYLKQSSRDSSNILNSSLLVAPVGIGLSYRLNEGEKFIPTMAISGAAKYYNDYITPPVLDAEITFSTQHEISSNFVFITNWKADKIITDTRLSGIFALTNTVTQNWSWFVEYFGTYSDEEFNNFGNLGTAYLLNENMQLDLFVGTNLDLDKTNYYFSLGISWRLEPNKERRKYNSPKGSEGMNRKIYTKYKNKGIK